VNPAVKVGVGLTICRQIVAFHGGKLQIETAVDTFVVLVVVPTSK
jgi:signal transduction histidine kinase